MSFPEVRRKKHQQAALSLTILRRSKGNELPSISR
jgi:hypothetical protein